MSAAANIKLKDVRELCTQSLSCVQKKSSSYTILLHPMHINNIKNGVKIELDSMVKSYCKQLKGIVLGYEKVKIYSSSGWIFDTNPFLHINIFADFYVFSPEVGSILNGKVVKKSLNHVGCLIHNIFNASSTIPNGINKKDWCGNMVREGDNVEMKVTELNLTCAVPFLRGDIIPESVSLASENLVKLKIKEEKIEDEDSEKSKEDKVEDEDSGISCMEKLNDESNEDSSKKKKKKKHPNVEKLSNGNNEISILPKKRKLDILQNSEDSDEEFSDKQKRRKLDESIEIKKEIKKEDTGKKKKKKKLNSSSVNSDDV